MMAKDCFLFSAVFLVTTICGLLFKNNGAVVGHCNHKGFMLGKQIIANDFHNHPCRRGCHPGDTPRVCEYEMDLSWYLTMSRACFYCPNKLADCERPSCILGSGTQKPVLVANRVLPGPSIEVCLGDRIRLKLVNMMQNGESIAIHWHGLHQSKSPHMDGVAMFSQCPVHPMTNFTYDFEADMVGTYFWHSHTGIQRADGMAGALIIRDPNDPQRHLYDRDDLQALVTQDWFPGETAISRFASFHFGNADFRPPQILVNGRWPSRGLEETRSTTLPPFPVKVPPFIYNLHPNLRYRFRIINNAFWNTPMKISIPGHNMVVIATDGQNIEPVVTETLTLMPAERYDIVPFFTGKSVSKRGVYYINVKALGDSEEIETAQAFAKIVYRGGKNPRPVTAWQASGQATKDVLKEVNYFSWDDYPALDDGKVGRKVSQLRSLEHHSDLDGEPDLKLLVEIDFDLVKDPRLYPTEIVRKDAPYISDNYPNKFITPRINKITNMMPSVPILTQWDEIPELMFCNSEHRMCDPDDYCECIHMEPIPLGALVEIVMVDNGFSDSKHDLNHPMHLHGYHFAVVASDKVHLNITGEEVLKMDRKGLIERNLNRPVMKDVVGVPTGGYVIIRFRADNPGPWLLHCHIDFHMELGMAMFLRVGKQSDLPPPPPGFPYCSSWEAPRYNLVKTSAGGTKNHPKKKAEEQNPHHDIEEGEKMTEQQRTTSDQSNREEAAETSKSWNDDGEE